MMVAAFLFFSPPSYAAPMFMGLGKLPGGIPQNFPFSVSGNGSVVVGYGQYASGIDEAYRWTSETGMVGLGSLPGETFHSVAYGTSVDGSVIVGRANSTFGYEAFRWASTGMVGLGDLSGSNSSSASDVSADGLVIVGRANSALGLQAFRWTSETGMVGLGDLPGGAFKSVAHGTSADGSVVVGSGAIWSSGDKDEAYRWTSETGMIGLGTLPGGALQSAAFAISADGSVIVGHANSAFGNEAFRWTSEAGMVGLGDLPGGTFQSTAADVSADGSVVVGHSLSALGSEAFIWNSTDGMRELDVVLSGLGVDLAGWSLTGAKGISDDGLTIVGWGTNPSGFSESFIATIPEPNTALLLLTGLLGLAHRQRRSRLAAPSQLEHRVTLDNSMPC